MMHGTKWQDQWARIYRWEERVRQTHDEYRVDIGQESQKDELYALYQAIWHLKDWLINDQAVPTLTKTIVERWVGRDPAARHLRVAADVANGSKHMVLTNKRAGGAAQTGGLIRVQVGENGGLSQRFAIADMTNPALPRKWDALKLSNECVKAWRRYLRRHSISVPNRPKF